METSTAFDNVVQSPMSAIALAFALGASIILVWFLVRRPKLTLTVKIVMFLGLGAMPIAAALAANVASFQTMSKRKFCGSCHVMTPYTTDAANPKSTSLPALHSRSPWFGGQSCYTCHSDYGMFGTVATKMAGLKHVWHYYTGYRTMSVAEALPKLHLYKPFPNLTCMQCHSTTLPGWSRVPEHASLLAEVRDDRVSCASEGCHGPAHKFSKDARKKLAEVLP